MFFKDTAVQKHNHCGASYQAITRSRSLMLQLFKCQSFLPRINHWQVLANKRQFSSKGEKTERSNFLKHQQLLMEVILTLQYLLTDSCYKKRKTVTGKISFSSNTSEFLIHHVMFREFVGLSQLSPRCFSSSSYNTTTFIPKHGLIKSM